MTVSDVLALFAYNAWANDRMLGMVEGLTEEQFTREVGGSFPTIRDTAAHVVSGEWIWLQRWRGVNPTEQPAWTSAPPVALLRVKLDEIETARQSFLQSLDDAGLEHVLTFRRLNGEEDSQALGRLLQHVVNHSSYHRGQVATMIRQVGGTPVSTDLLRYRP